MLKQNIYSKVFDVNEKFPREGFHGEEDCSKF